MLGCHIIEQRGVADLKIYLMHTFCKQDFLNHKEHKGHKRGGNSAKYPAGFFAESSSCVLFGPLVVEESPDELFV